MAHDNDNKVDILQYSPSVDSSDIFDVALKFDDPGMLNIHIDSSQEHVPEFVVYILKKACSKGAVNIVKFILKNLGEEQKYNLDKSLLEAAIVQGDNTEVVRSLLDIGMCRTELTENGDTDMLLAVRGGKCGILEVLLASSKTEQGATARINQCDKFGVFPLLCAVLSRQINCLKLLLNAGADLNQKVGDRAKSMMSEDEFLEQCDTYICENIDNMVKVSPGDSLLHIVLRKLGLRVFYKNAQEYFVYDTIFDLFLSQNIDVSVTDGKGHTLLDEAIISLCDVRTLDRLGERGCDILLPNPYHYACFEDSVDRLEVIKSHGFSVTSQSAECPFSPLFVACVDQNVKVVKWLLDNGADPSAYADSHVLCLWIASVNKFADDLVMDLDSYVSLMTPLHFTLLGSMSVFNSAIPLVEALCHHGVEINAQTSRGETPLFYMSRDLLGEDNFPVVPTAFEEFGSEESLFIMLIQAGADPDIGTHSGRFPIGFCIPESLSRIALMFLEVSTNLSKYFDVGDDCYRKACHISDMSFLPISRKSLKALIKTPRNLKVLCRKTILQACRGRHLNNDGCLKALPQTVLNYVTLKHLKDSEWYRNPNTL